MTFTVVQGHRKPRGSIENCVNYDSMSHRDRFRDIYPLETPLSYRIVETKATRTSFRMTDDVSNAIKQYTGYDGHYYQSSSNS